MKFTISILFFFTNMAWAVAPIKKQIPVADPIGKADINLDFAIDRPIVEAIHMDINVLCNDHRSQPNAAKPTIEKLLDGEKICAFDDYKFDKGTKVLTVRYSTGRFDGDIASCEEHWKQDIDLKEVCQSWNDDGARKPASELASSEENGSSYSRRRHRGVRERHHVRGREYYNSSFDVRDPNYDTNSFFSGSLVGSYRQQRGEYIGRDGLPRNSRREVNRCPGLESQGVSPCMSAIMAAESSCNARAVHNGGGGYGLCAINNNPKRFQYGREACADIRSTQGQINCCNAIFAKVGWRYFATRTRRIAASACGV